MQVSNAFKRDDKKIVQPIQPPGQRGQHQPRERRDSRGEHNQVSLFYRVFFLLPRTKRNVCSCVEIQIALSLMKDL